MSEKNCSMCSESKEDASLKVRRVYGCSGCADVGGVADRVSRKLRADKFADPSGSCLAGIGANIEPLIKAAKEVDEVITIDGCPMLCAKKIMDNHEIAARSFILTELGLEKGKTSVTDEIVEKMCNEIKTACQE